MNALIEKNFAELGRLCYRYHVRRLELFGSAAREDFDMQISDIDFLVEFKPSSAKEHYERYFGLLESLQALFKRPIDLVEAQAMRNPYFIRRVNQSRSTVYAA